MDKYLKLYKQMWIDWKNFDGNTNRDDFWNTVLINVAISAALGIIFGFIRFLNWVPGLYGLAILVPMIAMGIRRLIDVGEKPLYLLWWLLPIVGWIMVVLKWVKPSKAA